MEAAKTWFEEKKLGIDICNTGSLFAPTVFHPLNFPMFPILASIVIHSLSLIGVHVSRPFAAQYRDEENGILLIQVWY